MVLRAVSDVLGKPLPYDTLDQVHQRLEEVAPHFGRISSVQKPLWLNGEYFKVRPPCPGLVSAGRPCVRRIAGLAAPAMQQPAVGCLPRGIAEGCARCLCRPMQTGRPRRTRPRRSPSTAPS